MAETNTFHIKFCISVDPRTTVATACSCSAVDPRTPWPSPAASQPQAAPATGGKRKNEEGTGFSTEGLPELEGSSLFVTSEGWTVNKRGERVDTLGRKTKARGAKGKKKHTSSKGKKE